MRLVIASDIHGAAKYCERLLAQIEKLDPDKVVLLGDLLYHGPRNDLPKDYAPKSVIAMLNSISNRVMAVRGNCEAEVDQMVLEFSCLAEYSMILDPDPKFAYDKSKKSHPRQLFFSHGHIYSPQNLPNIPPGSAFISGHTHVKVNACSPDFPSIWLFNPGSVGIPKDGSHSFGIYEDGVFSHVILD